MIYDVIVIGAGPAGLTAALYALRAEKSVLILEKETFGGQITASPKIENYPGIPQMSGNEFADQLLEQVLSHGAEAEMERAVGIRAEGDLRTVETESGATFTGKTVIIAVGARHRMLGLPKEEAFVGAGISYCAVCDGAFYKGKRVAVIGGGNSALVEAVLLAEGCEKVTIVQNLAFLTGEKKLISKLESAANVEIRYNTVVEALEGEDALQALLLKNTETGATERLEIDGAFVAIGMQPENEAFASVLPLDAQGYLPAGEACRTNDAAVFVAGDCRAKSVRQITTAVGDGATAAVGACRYLDA